MYKITLIFFILVTSIFFSISCNSKSKQTPNTTTTPSSTPPIQVNTPNPYPVSTTPDGILNQALARDPEGQILAQAQIIKDRLRYFGEELKTTHKTDKQKALMEDVRKNILLACKEIETIIPTTIFYEEPNVNNFLALCYKIDKALATHDPKVLPEVLKDFNLVYDKLEARLKKTNQ
ncbi:MAG: hypothetical protein HY819_08355 [Acidobacteria bacterium]|nr:hypothetical protein [Acidobacteriota bacterium]